MLGQYQFHNVPVLTYKLNFYLRRLVTFGRSCDGVRAHAHAHRRGDWRPGDLLPVKTNHRPLGQAPDSNGRNAGILALDLLLHLGTPGCWDPLAPICQVALVGIHCLNWLGQREVDLADVVQDGKLMGQIVEPLELDDGGFRLPIIG
jgi:hypothetical protein